MFSLKYIKAENFCQNVCTEVYFKVLNSYVKMLADIVNISTKHNMSYSNYNIIS